MLDMAEELLRGSSQETTATTAIRVGDLPDELVLEILARLPPKYAHRCLSLNKTYFAYVSGPSFLRRNAVLTSRCTNTTIVFSCSAHKPKIFTKIALESACKRTVSAHLHTEVSVLASCNGLLLLKDIFDGYYVFNPITGGIMYDNGSSYAIPHDVGLAVDLEQAHLHPFKLVILYTDPITNPSNTFCRFNVVVPTNDDVNDGESSTMLKTHVDFACGMRFIPMPDDNIRPVYAHGCLYWLGQGAKKILEFNVNKERARIINGPVRGNECGTNVDQWFGQARGSLSFIYVLPEKIVVCIHDHQSDKWRLQYRIRNICNTTINDYRHGYPVFFDGERLYLKLWKSGQSGRIYMYDLSTRKWETRGSVPSWSDGCQIFTAFVPTLAKVWDEYLHSASCWGRRFSFVKDSLLILQELFRRVV